MFNTTGYYWTLCFIFDIQKQHINIYKSKDLYYIDIWLVSLLHLNTAKPIGPKLFVQKVLNLKSTMSQISQKYLFTQSFDLNQQLKTRRGAKRLKNLVLWVSNWGKLCICICILRLYILKRLKFKFFIISQVLNNFCTFLFKNFKFQISITVYLAGILLMLFYTFG